MSKSRPASPGQIEEMVRPAVQAWLQLRPGSSRPRAITLLKNTFRSTVCRIEGVGPGGSHIISKWCPRADGESEAFIYGEILEQLSLESVRCYGFVEEGAGEYGWLFLEDCGNTTISGKGESLRAAFSHWLARLHGAASNLRIGGRLPERGPEWYLEILRRVRRDLCQSVAERDWSDRDRSVAESILVCLEILERSWHVLEELCVGLPQTLVHCDLQPKNVLIRHTDSGVAFLPLDWEEAGWGPPAPDLAKIDTVSYWATARETCASMKLERVEEQARCGVLFQNLSAIAWEMVRLAAGSQERAMRRLRIYAPQLNASTQALGLEV